MDILAATCKAINNANRMGKRQVLVRKSSKCVLDFLEFMMQHGYLSKITYVDDHKQGKIIIDLNGRLVKCGAICPRFNVKLKEIENWRDRVLPARQFGHLVVTTSKGMMDHNDCLEKTLLSTPEKIEVVDERIFPPDIKEEYNRAKKRFIKEKREKYSHNFKNSKCCRKLSFSDDFKETSSDEILIK